MTCFDPARREASNGLSKALKIMDAAEPSACELDGEPTVTPATKRPRLADSVKMNLEITPPPVVERQSVSRLLGTTCVPWIVMLSI